LNYARVSADFTRFAKP